MPIVTHPSPPPHPENLRASHPNNSHDARHGIFSQKMRAPRAAECAEALMALPHAVDIDQVAASVVGDLYALHEGLAGEMQKCLERLTQGDPDDEAAALVRLTRLAEIEVRTARGLLDGLEKFSATPASRARHRRDHQMGETLAESARRLRKGGA